MPGARTVALTAKCVSNVLAVDHALRPVIRQPPSTRVAVVAGQAAARRAAHLGLRLAVVDQPACSTLSRRTHRAAPAPRARTPASRRGTGGACSPRAPPTPTPATPSPARCRRPARCRPAHRAARARRASGIRSRADRRRTRPAALRRVRTGIDARSDPPRRTSATATIRGSARKS